MSNQFPSPAQYDAPMPVAVPPKPSKLKRFGLPVGLLLLGLMLGGVVGAVAKPDPPVQVQEKIVEKKVEVPTTPQSCLTAITYAEQIISSSGRTVGVFVDVLDAVKTFNAAKITALSPKIDDETTLITGITPKYQSARDSCRASR